MKIAIATPAQAGEEWTPFLTDFCTPNEIRARIRRLSESDSCICTMNTTVLNETSSYGCLSYEDVLVWVDGQGLVPLLDLHSEEWLCQVALGDLFERNRI